MSVVKFAECVVWWLMCLLCVLVAVWSCEELLCLALVYACECGINGANCFFDRSSVPVEVWVGCIVCGVVFREVFNDCG